MYATIIDKKLDKAIRSFVSIEDAELYMAYKLNDDYGRYLIQPHKNVGIRFDRFMEIMRLMTYCNDKLEDIPLIYLCSQ